MSTRGSDPPGTSLHELISSPAKHQWKNKKIAALNLRQSKHAWFAGASLAISDYPRTWCTQLAVVLCRGRQNLFLVHAAPPQGGGFNVYGKGMSMGRQVA